MDPTGAQDTGVMANITTMVRESLWFVRAYLLIAVIGAVINYRAVMEAGPRLVLLIVAGYLGAGLACGVVLGIMYPLRKWLLGRVLMGIIAAFTVALALTPVVLSRGPMSLHRILLVAAIFAVVLGPVGAVVSWQHRPTN